MIFKVSKFGILRLEAKLQAGALRAENEAGHPDLVRSAFAQWQAWLFCNQLDARSAA